MKIRLRKLARIADAELVGEDVDISGVADIERASAGDITYAVNDRYARELRLSKASAAVVPLNVTDIGKPMIRTDNPYYAFARILEVFAPALPSQEPPVHLLACIAADAEVGSGTVVGPFAVIAAGVRVGRDTHVGAFTCIGPLARVGDGCIIHPHVVIGARCIVGDRVIIQPGTVIGSDGYGFCVRNGRPYKIPQIGIVEVQDDVEIGSNTTIDRATMGRTVVGAGTKIDNLVQIGHNVEIGRNSFIVAQVGISGSTKIGNGCRFAGQSATSGHMTIGDGCTVAARGVVTKDIPPGSFVSGFPARRHRDELKLQACLRELPDLLDQVRALKRGDEGPRTRKTRRR